MKYVVWGLIVLLLILHQDVWFWDDHTLVFGFMPITLLFHAAISLAAGFAWYLATIYCWPALDEEELAHRSGQQASAPSIKKDEA